MCGVIKSLENDQSRRRRIPLSWHGNAALDEKGQADVKLPGSFIEVMGDRVQSWMTRSLWVLQCCTHLRIIFFDVEDVNETVALPRERWLVCST